MLAFGIGSGYLKATFRRRMTLVAAAVIIILGLVYLNRGALLLGSPVTFQSIKQGVVGTAPSAEAEFTVADDGVVEVSLSIVNTTFRPDTVRIPADRPVRLLVDRQEAGACSDEIWLPQLGVRESLEPFAVTRVALPATAAGRYTLTCGMGMMSGTLIAGDAGGGASPLGLWIAGIAVLGAAAWFWRSRPVAPARILGMNRNELLVVLTVLAAAVIAGLALGGAFR
jgi:hypothetical protein